jgi:hypothetical protein
VRVLRRDYGKPARSLRTIAVESHPHLAGGWIKGGSARFESAARTSGICPTRCLLAARESDGIALSDPSPDENIERPGDDAQQCDADHGQQSLSPLVTCAGIV